MLPCAIHYDGYDGKMHFFKPSYVRFGKMIPADELKIQGLDRAEVRRASNRIMGAITAMWEEETGWKSE